jgi:putative redox protein
MDAKVTWDHGLSFKGTADTNFVVPLGASSTVGGDEDGFRPMELLATGLAGCTAMDVISILSKKKQEVTAFEVKVHTEQSPDYPKVFTNAVIEYHVTGKNIDEEAVRRSIELSAVRYCPAQAMFSKVMPIRLVYYIYDVIDGGQAQLRKSSDFVPG